MDPTPPPTPPPPPPTSASPSWPEPEPLDPFAAEETGGLRGARPLTLLAWVVILLACIAAVVLGQLGQTAASTGERDELGLVLMQVQSKYIVGAAQVMGSGDLLYQQSGDMLDLGTVDQRQRFVTIAAELAGPAEAAIRLEALEQDIATPMVGPPPELTEAHQRVQAVLHELYPMDGDDEALGDRVAALDDADRQLLRDELEWFGELALVPVQAGDREARRKIIEPAQVVAYTLIGGVFVGAGVGFLGFVGLVILFVLAITNKITGGLGAARGRQGLYAETFAIWLIAFFLLQIPAQVVGMKMPSLAMPAVLVAFFGSLFVLVWPVMRGIPWRDVRQDIGWTLGRSPVLEPVIGVFGYFMALPLLGIGVLLTLMLISVQAAFTEAGSTFGPTGGPAHPVIVELASGPLWMKLQVLALGSLAAPIVEETMFRGVLYRHLRESSRTLGTFASVVVSGTISSLIFAAIHPQGWVAIPALMSLAYAFVILREWRGTLIPSMIIHGLSNGIVMSLVIFLLTA